MNFSDIMLGVQPRADGFRGQITEDWMQGRSAFGGIQVALALRAMRLLRPEAPPLRTLQTTFMAPVPAGRVDLTAAVLRAGKNTLHMRAELVDGDAVLCTVVGVFGAARESQVRIQPTRPQVADPGVAEAPYVPGVMPSFLQHYSTRWLRGGVPFSGAASPQAVIELGCREVGEMSTESVVALADVIPPAALSLLRKPAFGSSMTWALDLLRERYDDLPRRGWRMDVELPSACDGYTSQSAMMWGPGGEPAALSRQCMTIFG